MTESLRFNLEQGIATHFCPCASAVQPLRLSSLFRTSMFSPEPDGAAGPSTSQAFADFPSLPDFEQDGFRHSVDLLEGFEEFMDLTPNAPTSSYAAHGFDLETAASAPTANSGTPARPNAEAPAATTATDNDRRTFRNRLSQRRFRERQRVGCCCCCFVTA